MPVYFELREHLAEAYLHQTDWERAVTESGLNRTDVDYHGTPIAVWTNILGQVRDRRRLPGLRALLAREQPNLLDLFDKYAEEVASGEHVLVDLPELRDVELIEADLQPNVIGASLSFEQVLPIGLLNLSLAGGQPSRDTLDSLLPGSNEAAAKARLAHYRDEQARALAPLQNRRNEVARNLERIIQRTSSIENMQRPQPPSRRDLTLVSEGDRSFWSDQYAKDTQRYQEALASYDAEKKMLPALQRERDELRRELADRDIAIAAQRAHATAGEQAFDDDIAQAVDADMQGELDRTSRAATVALRSEANPFKGLWALLGTNCLLDLFMKFAAQPAAATEAGRRFHDVAEALVQPLQDGLASIARGCLAGPTYVLQTLTKSRNEETALLARLALLPVKSMEEGNARADAVLRVPLPPIPSSGNAEKPDILENVRKRLLAIQADTQGHMANLRSELDGEPVAIRTAVEHAQLDIASTFKELTARAEMDKAVLAKSGLLWSLIKRGALSADLPAYARKLCQALIEEFARRAKIAVDSVFEQASDTEFGVNTTKAAIDAHLLTAYASRRDKLKTCLADVERQNKEIAEELGKIDRRYEEVETKYRRRLQLAAAPSWIPGVNLFTAMWAAAIVVRLEDMVTSDKAPYIRLGEFAAKALAWTVAGTVVGCAVSTAITALVFSGHALDFGEGAFSEGTMAACLALASYVALVLAVRNQRALRISRAKPGRP